MIWQGTLTGIFEFHHPIYEPVSVDGVLWTQSGTSETRVGGTYRRERAVHTRARIDTCIYRVGVLKGISLLSLTNTLGIPYLVILLIEILIMVGLSYLFYNKTRSVI